MISHKIHLGLHQILKLIKKTQIKVLILRTNNNKKYIAYAHSPSKYSIFFFLKVLISSTGKISDSWIRNLRFNPYLHKKPIDVFFFI